MIMLVDGVKDNLLKLNSRISRPYTTQDPMILNFKTSDSTLFLIIRNIIYGLN